jgi:hypothetical protein
LGQREGRAHWKNALYGEVWLAGGERWWGGVQGWWSTAHGAGRLYTVARCSGRGRIGRREARASCPRWLSGSGNGGTVGGGEAEEEERVLHGEGGRPL